MALKELLGGAVNNPPKSGTPQALDRKSDDPNIGGRPERENIDVASDPELHVSSFVMASSFNKGNMAGLKCFTSVYNNCNDDRILILSDRTFYHQIIKRVLFYTGKYVREPVEDFCGGLEIVAAQSIGIQKLATVYILRRPSKVYNTPYLE